MGHLPICLHGRARVLVRVADTLSLRKKFYIKPTQMSFNLALPTAMEAFREKLLQTKKPFIQSI